MAKADHQSTTWITLKEAQLLVVEICLSPSRAGPWLVEQIAAKRVRVRWRGVDPPGAAVEDICPNDTIDFADCSVTKLVVAPPGTVVGLCPVTLFGVEVVREDIEAQRALPSIEPIATSVPVVMTAAQKREWLHKAKRKRRRQEGETHRTWAKAMIVLQREVCTNVWPLETMERRLRDKVKEPAETSPRQTE